MTRFCVVTALAVLCMGAPIQAQEDALFDESQVTPASESGGGVIMATGGYMAEAIEKLLFGVTDIATTPVEILATPFKRAAWADATRRPVLWFFTLGIVEGTMNGYFRVSEGVANVATFPIAASRNRFANYSIWYWDRYQPQP